MYNGFLNNILIYGLGVMSYHKQAKFNFFIGSKFSYVTKFLDRPILVAENFPAGDFHL